MVVGVCSAEPGIFFFAAGFKYEVLALRMKGWKHCSETGGEEKKRFFREQSRQNIFL